MSDDSADDVVGDEEREMKRLLLLSMFLCACVCGYSQIIKVTMNDGISPVVSAHVIAKGKVIAVTDSAGTVAISNVDRADKIEVTHLLYHSEVFRCPVQDTVIALQDIHYSLPSAMRKHDDGMAILSSKLKSGLHISNRNVNVPVTASITMQEGGKDFSFTATGITRFYSYHKKPVVKVSEIVPNTDLSKDQNKIFLKKGQESIRDEAGCGMYYACHALDQLHSEYFFVEYIGESGGDSVFKFFFTPQHDSGETKAKGLLYVSSDGILYRLDACLSRVGENDYSPYDMTTFFHYNDKDNSILPERSESKIYHLDDKRNIRRIVVDIELRFL
ncbi:MAG: hypothetical protein MJY84_00870 [Bacteroidales bacterium]|nr:hypothetical protein [Bacteroidales bacterium]